MRFLCDISDNEGSGKCYLASADNTCWDLWLLQILQKLIFHWFEENDDKPNLTQNAVWHFSWKSCITLYADNLQISQLSASK